ncbi:MAG TPA: hydroxyethylthiazole kinase [Clostridia bacterium]|nr:hydroxyethylthiazole kinase [Clostridia bacterium]
MFEKVLERVNKNSPLLHCITNYVTVNDCANIILACGASPIMADDISEVEEITSICNALVINIGTLNERTVSAMVKAGMKANKLGHPVILDPVGAGASKLRTETISRLINKVKFSVIRGNISEIKTVYQGSGTTKGVDADIKDIVNEDNISGVITFAKSLSERTGAVIVITGAIDIVTDCNNSYLIRNGHPMMAKITGSGCMLTTVIGSFCGANSDNILDATAAAVCAMGICGELAYEKLAKSDGGTSTYRSYIIDFMSKMDAKVLNGGIKIESR